MIEWIDDLDRYTTSRPVYIPETEAEWDHLNTGPCIQCGKVDELSWYWCWDCIKEKNGLV